MLLRQAMLKRPRDGRLLFGLQQSLLAQGRKDEASLVELQYLEAWKYATTKMSLEEL